MKRTTLALISAVATIPLITATGSLAQPISAAQADFSIVNGTVASPNAAPAFIQIVSTDDDHPGLEHACGGSLVAGDWILTSASCLWEDDEHPTPEPVHEFKAIHHQSGEIRAIDRILFPDHIRQIGWPADIALVHVSQPFKTGARVVLPAADQPAPTTGTGTIWGKGDAIKIGNDFELDSRDPLRSQLRRADVPFNPASTCGDSLLHAGMICAESHAPQPTLPGSCDGDEGGPVSVASADPNRMMIVGVISDVDDIKGDRCGQRPMWYTNVSAWTKWIAATVPGVLISQAGPTTPTQPGATPPQPGSTPTQPGTTPIQPISCGPVTAPGKPAPTTVTPTMTWTAPRGQAVGSSISVTASKLTFNANERADYAVIAGECAWADALAATSLADNGPILLTDPNGLENEISGELKRLGVKHVYIIGGERAVAPAVEAALTGQGYVVTRLAGASRVQTAAVVAKEASKDDQTLDGAVIARAYPAAGGNPAQAFADSLASAYYVPWEDSPVLLSDTHQLSVDTATYLREYKPEQVLMMGGPGALNATVEYELGRLLPGTPVSRIAGASRADTAAKLAMRMMNAPDDQAKALLVVDGQDDDAWKVGFTFSSFAAETKSVYALAAGNTLAPESVALIKEAKKRGLPVRCIASEQACAAAAKL